MNDEGGVAGRLVLVVGATSASGLAASRTLAAAGARVVAIGRDPRTLAPLLSRVQDAPSPATSARGVADTRPGWVRGEVCDVTDEDAVAALARRVRDADGAVDGILHLVGGWRGGGGLAGQTDEDFRFLEGSLTALRHVSRAFDADLRASTAGRIAIVSSTAVDRPLAGGANYAAVKAACEAWMRAVAQGYAKAAKDAGEPLAAASVIFRVTSLDGLEQHLADAWVGLWDAPPTDLNGTVLTLTGAHGSAAGRGIPN